MEGRSCREDGERVEVLADLGPGSKLARPRRSLRALDPASTRRMTSTGIARSASGCSPASNLNHALRRGWKLSTYRTEAAAEVDLVIERARAVVAIEIKAGKQVTPADTRGLLSFAGM